MREAHGTPAGCSFPRRCRASVQAVSELLKRIGGPSACVATKKEAGNAGWDRIGREMLRVLNKDLGTPEQMGLNLCKLPAA